jgi:MFS family permease
MSFAGLFLCRFLLGFAEGPVVPLTQSMMAAESDPRRRGLNIGILQMGGAFLIGGTAGPVIATLIADAYGWRVAFTVSALPGLLMAVLLAWFVRPRLTRQAAAAAPKRAPAWQSIVALWRIGNIRTTILISGLFAAWYTIQSVFLPIYLTTVKGLAPTTMGWIVGAGGIAGLVGGIAVPALSDIVGRRPMMIACSFLAMAAPIAILMLPNNPLLLAAAVLLGWMVVGISPLYIGIVPSESAPLGLVTTAIGLTTAAGELVGGVIAPAVAGQLADLFGLAVPLYLCIGLAFACGVTCLCLTETNRSRLALPERRPALPLQG